VMRRRYDYTLADGRTGTRWLEDGDLTPEELNAKDPVAMLARKHDVSEAEVMEVVREVFLGRYPEIEPPALKRDPDFARKLWGGPPTGGFTRQAPVGPVWNLRR